MSVHTVHFPPVPKPDPARSPTDGRRKVGTRSDDPRNAIQAYSDALRDTELVRERLRNLLNSANRHGDLQVALSAAERLRGSIQLLIDTEESA